MQLVFVNLKMVLFFASIFSIFIGVEEIYSILDKFRSLNFLSFNKVEALLQYLWNRVGRKVL